MNLKSQFSFKFWVLGMVSAFIVGGAGAVQTSMTAMVIAPNEFNLTDKFRHVLILAGVTFVWNGILGAAAYLKNHPLDEVWDGQDRRGQSPAGDK